MSLNELLMAENAKLRRSDPGCETQSLRDVEQETERCLAEQQRLEKDVRTPKSKKLIRRSLESRKCFSQGSNFVSPATSSRSSSL